MDVGSFLSNLFSQDNIMTGIGLAAQQAITNEAVQDIKGVGQDAYAGAQTLGDQAFQRSRFKPFSVAGPAGNVGATAEGNLSLSLSPERQAMSNQLFSTGQNFLGRLGGSTADREQAIFDKINALQAPSRERDYLTLEERLFNQGRSGVRTDAFGGTPEMLAFAKATEEARRQAAVDAIGMSQQQTGMDANIATALMNAGYQPENQLMQAAGAGLNVADLMGAGNRAGAQYATTLGQTGLQGLVNANTAAANLRGNQLNSAAQTVGNIFGGMGSATVQGTASAPAEGNFFTNLYNQFLDPSLGG
jgi:hypothetical protein